MKSTASPWVLPDAAAERARRADDEVRVSDFLLFAAMPFRVLTVAGLPVNELAGLAVVLLAALRNPGRDRRLPAVVLLLCAAVLGLLLYSGIVNGVDWTRRVGHVAIWCGLIWALATGRVSLRSAALGLASGLIAVIGLALAGIGFDGGYEDRLTGYLGDPNAAAYFILVLGALAVGFGDQRTKVRLLIAAPLVLGLVLTYSRTGLVALAFAVIWWAVGRRLGALGGVAVVAALAWSVANIPQDLALFGPFSNRSGSDALRERIIAREHSLVAQAPWHGNGPGTANVDLAGNQFYFHNSYLATRQEGGWVLLVLVLVLIALAFLAVTRAARARDLPSVSVQVALIGVVVMAATLGEVLLELPTAIAIGFAFGHAHSLAQPRTPPATHTPTHPVAEAAPPGVAPAGRPDTEATGA